MTDVVTALTAEIGTVLTAVGTLVAAGLGIFAVIWGVRKAKAAVAAGS